jgi:hypothetical protein
MKEKGYDPKKHKMGVLDEQLKHTSELYAPMKRHGISYKNRDETLAQKHFTFDDSGWSPCQGYSLKIVI